MYVPVQLHEVYSACMSVVRMMHIRSSDLASFPDSTQLIMALSIKVGRGPGTFRHATCVTPGRRVCGLVCGCVNPITCDVFQRYGRSAKNQREQLKNVTGDSFKNGRTVLAKQKASG